jgi:quercetin dioxygenase-like cupin family protein
MREKCLMSSESRDGEVLHIPPDGGRSFLVLSDLVTFKLGPQQTHGAFFLGTALVRPQGGVILHVQPTQQETFFIIEGTFEITWLRAGEPIVCNATPGSVVHIPEGVPHSYKNVGATPGRMLFFLSPAGKSAQFFEEIGVTVEDLSSPPEPVLPDLPTLLALAQKYQLELVAPPSTVGGEAAEGRG